MNDYTSDPVGFMRQVLGFEPWSMQHEIAEAVRDRDRVAVKAANAVGKTALAAQLIPWWLAGGPGSIVVTTSMTERQVKRVLWREARRAFKRADGFFRGVTLTDTEAFLAPDWYALGFSADETESVQGFHGERVLVVVDEASGVAEAVFEALEGLLAGGDAKLLLIGNALRTSGTFFDAFHSQRGAWRTFTVSAFDTPGFTGEPVSREVRRRLVSRRWVESLERKRGTESNEYRVRVLAEFPKAQDDAVVSLADLEGARTRQLAPGLPLVIGVDVARFGFDRSVVALRRGNVIRVVKAYSGRDLMHTTGEVIQVARAVQNEHGRKPTLVIDDTGLGGGVTDRLRELNEFRVIDFVAGRKSSSRDYPNRRSELWFRVAELLPVLDLDPGDEELMSDLLAPTYMLTSDGRRVVEAKSDTRKRLRRSPDRADAVLLTCAVDPPAAPGRARRRRVRISSPVGYRLPQPGAAVAAQPDPEVTVARLRARAGTAPGRIPGVADLFVDAVRARGIPVYDKDAARSELDGLMARARAGQQR